MNCTLIYSLDYNIISCCNYCKIDISISAYCNMDYKCTNCGSDILIYNKDDKYSNLIKKEFLLDSRIAAARKPNSQLYWNPSQILSWNDDKILYRLFSAMENNLYGHIIKRCREVKPNKWMIDETFIGGINFKFDRQYFYDR